MPFISSKQSNVKIVQVLRYLPTYIYYLQYFNRTVTYRMLLNRIKRFENNDYILLYYT